MVYKTLILSLFLSSAVLQPALAQLASQKDAAYLATIKAVADYKVNDEESIQQVQLLREDEVFKQKLKKMMEKLQNSKSKDSSNRKIYNILLVAGKQIYDELN